MSFEDEPEDWVTEIFEEAQGSVSTFKRVASLLGPSGSMSVFRRAVRERPRSKNLARAPSRNASPPGFEIKASPCLLCGERGQEYGSCRCAHCNQQRRLKRKPKYRPQRIQESP
jgi:hypothetical protein